MKKNVLVLALSLFALDALAAARAEACSCLPLSLEGQYWSDWNTDIFRGVVKSRKRRGNQVSYQINVTNTFKGCIKPGARVTVTTADNEAACGVTLANGREYLITASSQGGGLSINLCGHNRQWSSLAGDEQSFLNNRYVCCGNGCRCATGGLVQCFAQPCAVDACAVPGAVCNDNYCNGCHAEWFDGDGAPVCYACQADWDCGWGQACVNGECQ